jgi:hypothetical protein
VKGFAYDRNNSAIRSEKVAEIIYSDNSKSDLVANGSNGEFSEDRCWDNLPKGNFKVKSVGVTGLAGVLKPNGSPGGGCSRDTTNNQYINCNMNSFAFSASSNAGGGFNFLEQVAANPSCAVPKISDTSRNCSGDGKSVTVSWNSTNCSSYRVQYTQSSTFDASKATAPIYSTDVTKTSATINNLEAAKTWYFRVACIASTSCTPQTSGGYYIFSATESEAACAAPTATASCSFDLAPNPVSLRPDGLCQEVSL